MSKAIELAKKLKSLADKGIDGEKENAKTLLTQYLQKHNISLSDLESDRVSTYFFDTVKDYTAARFFRQIISNICGDERHYWTLSIVEKKNIGASRNNAITGYTVTCAEQIEIVQTFEFYHAEYLKQLELFYQAFIQKNELYQNTDRTNERSKKSMEAPDGLYKMMLGVKKINRQKRIA